MEFLFAVASFTLLPARYSSGPEYRGCKHGLMVALLKLQWQNISWTATVPFLSMVMRRSCLLCDWVQLMAGSPSPSSVWWPTVRIWIWPSSGPSIAAKSQSHKNKLHQNTNSKITFSYFAVKYCKRKLIKRGVHGVLIVFLPILLWIFNFMWSSLNYERIRAFDRSIKGPLLSESLMTNIFIFYTVQRSVYNSILWMQRRDPKENNQSVLLKNIFPTLVFLFHWKTKLCLHLWCVSRLTVLRLSYIIIDSWALTSVASQQWLRGERAALQAACGDKCSVSLKNQQRTAKRVWIESCSCWIIKILPLDANDCL